MAKENGCDSATIVTSLRGRQEEDRGLITGNSKAYFLHHRFLTDSGIRPFYCVIGIEAIQQGKATGAWNCLSDD
jgi:hypothetical protein